MKKLMMVAAMLAVALVVAIPAVAQVGGGVGQESESGDVALKDAVSNEGNYARQCTPAQQFGNTGNFDNGSAFVQYASESDDFKPGGIAFSDEPTVTVDCPSTISQSSAASA